MSKLVLFAAASGSNVDRDNGVLRNVSIISKGPAKGHTVMGQPLIVDDETLDQVVTEGTSFQDGIPVNFDHGTGISDLVGSVRDVRRDGDQVRGDLYLLKSHEAFGTICEMAETMPSNFGLSISFANEPDPVFDAEDQGDEDAEIGENDVPDSSVVGNDIVAYAARIVPGQLFGADLVKSPATNAALFQASMSEPTTSLPEGQILPEAVEEAAPPLIETVISPEPSAAVVTEVSEPVGSASAEGTVEENAEAEVAEEATPEVVETKLSAIHSEFASNKTELAAVRTELSALRTELAAKDAELSKLQKVHLAAKRALGLAPSEVLAEIEDSTPASTLVEQYEALPKGSPERLAFFNANRSALFEAANGRSRK